MVLPEEPESLLKRAEAAESLEPTPLTGTKYRKKPVVIEAERLTPETIWQIRDWCDGRIYPGNQRPLHIPTLEGVMEAEYGDWIIKGVQGEFYPCKPNIFDATYEPVDD